MPKRTKQDHRPNEEKNVTPARVQATVPVVLTIGGYLSDYRKWP